MSRVIIDRVDYFKFSFAGSDAGGKRVVARALTFANPSPFAYSPTIEMFDRRALTFRIGMLNTVIAACEKRKVSYEVYDYDFQFPAGVEIDDRMSGRYEHQREAVRAFFERRFGIVIVPTRGGKTMIASECIRIFNATDTGQVLFVVDNTTLFDQAVRDIRTFFERYGGIDVGEIREGHIDVEHRVTVAMVQTLQSTLSKRCQDRKKKTTLQKFLKGLRFLIVDEIHDNSSDTRMAIYKRCRELHYQLCLSATPYRAGAFKENLKLQAWSGDVIYTISEQTLKERGVLTDYKVFLLVLEQSMRQLRARSYADYQKALIFDSDARDAIVMNVVEMCRRNHWKTLLLFTSVAHGRKIADISGERFLSGDTPGPEREAAKEAFLRADGGILLASGIFKKGVTLPEVEIIFNIDGGLEDANTIQKKGRVLGTTADKVHSAVIDFIDVCDAYFSEHSLTRLDVYERAVGEQRLGILDTEDGSWLNTLEEWLKKWLSVNTASTPTR